MKDTPNINTGFLLINKPSGPTSHDVINRLRRITGIKKIGHAGTLDPFASGLLIVAVGREATREIAKFVKLDKVYLADLKLGAVSDTYDRTGRIVECRMSNVELETNDIKKTLEKFTGKQKQVPPMFSAKKVKGRKLYELARKGIEIEREPIDVEIYSLDLLAYQWPNLRLKIHCTSGTYIRSLAHNLGQALDCGAFLQELKRTAIGPYRVEKALAAEALNADNWPDKLFLPG